MVRLGLVVATYHEPIVERMERHAMEAADEADAEIVETYHVPGSYDTVLPAARLARRLDIDAVVVIGALIAGETEHDRVIGRAVADNLHRVALEEDTPVTFGISGPGMTPEVATDRVAYGANAVEAAVDLVVELEG